MLLIEGIDGPKSTEDKGANEAPAKPCCRRLPGGRYCLLPELHIGDCEGVTPREIPPSDTGPKRRPQWGR